MNALESRLVISQPEATLYIQPPTFETTVAIQITVNALWRNGFPAWVAGCEFEVAGASFMTAWSNDSFRADTRNNLSGSDGQYRAAMGPRRDHERSASALDHLV